MEDGARQALTRLVAGEHAAVFAYALVAAQVAAADRERARTQWRLHLERRDRYEQALTDGGAQPPAARPAYDVGDVSGPAAARALAARVESGVATVALAAVAATRGALRSELAVDAVEAARRAARWSGRLTPA